MKTARFLFLLPALLLASCAGGGSSDGAATAAAKPSGARMRTLDDWANDISKDNGFIVDAGGNYVPKSNKRSSFDRNNRNSPYFKEGYAKKEYGGTKDYAKKSWWGNTTHEKKSYEGDTDGSRFQTPSRLQGKGARETGTAANLPGDYRTGTYETGSAREAGQGGIARPSDAETDVRRRVFSQPSVINYREQRKMSVQQTNSILGR